MAEEAGMEKKQSGVSHLKWALVLGIAILTVIVLGLISSRAIHGILNKKSYQATSSQIGQ